MALITGVTLPNNGDRIKVENYNDPIQKILAQVNGNLDDTNIASLSGTKITAGTVPSSALTTAALEQLSAGWRDTTAPSSVTYNGQKSYNIVINGVDRTDVLQPGTRIRTTRTVAAPTQVTSLNGTNHFYSKATPAGMTFTDDFAAGAWIKITSYQNESIISRFNGTSGWDMKLDALGRVTLEAFNAGGGNFSYVFSQQSVPLNRWVHVAVQLDMSSFTTTTTTSYVMIDGVDVPAVVVRGGTNPTALIQAGNLEIGSWNGGLQPFAGKLAQVFVTNTKITQANVRALQSQTLTTADMGTYGIASAYTFNNSLSDLNTTNANNLTANNGVVATNGDSPYGGNSFGNIVATQDYGIIMQSTFSTNTTLVVQAPEGNTIPTTGGVTSLAYSNARTPYGMPADTEKWTLLSLQRAAQNRNSPAANTWYNPTGSATSGDFVAPIGKWRASLRGIFQANKTAAAVDVYGALSTSNSATTNDQLIGGAETGSSPAVGGLSVFSNVNVTAQQNYYILFATTYPAVNSLFTLINSFRGAVVIEFSNNYL